MYVLLFNNVKFYIILYVNIQILSLIINLMYTFHRHALVHNINVLFIQKVSLMLLRSMERYGISKLIII
jgi:hypothetical protein